MNPFLEICSHCGERVALDAPRIQSQRYKGLPMPYCQRCFDRITKENAEREQERLSREQAKTEKVDAPVCNPQT